MNCGGHDKRLGCLIYKALAKKNGPFKLEERMECPDGLDYGRVHSTGPATCTFDCDVCLGRVKVLRGNNTPSLNVELQVKMPTRSNLKRMDTAPTGSCRGDRDKETPVNISHTRNTISENCRINRASMLKKERKRAVTCATYLSKPRGAAFVNELKLVKENPTPERAAHLLEFTEDMKEI